MATAAIAAVGAIPATAQAATLPPCQNALAATGSGSYDFGRINSSGYAAGSLLGLNVGLVDQVTPSNAPKVFQPQAPAPVQSQQEVAGDLITLSYPGLPNTLAGVTPTTNVQISGVPPSTGPTSYAGAHTLSVIFNGRVTIYQPTTFSCQSVTDPNTFWNITISKVALDGYGTSVPTGLEPFGTGLDIGISPGDTSSL